MQRILTSFFLVLLGLSASACAGGSENVDSANTLGSGSATSGMMSTTGASAGTGGSGGSDVCLLHNCGSDAECAGCSEGRVTCYVPDKRCVACDPDTGKGCPDGQMCTEFGNCVDSGLTCPVDGDGNPTVTCNDDPDCGACDPDHQVCDKGQCVQCRGDSMDACNGDQQCVGDKCVSKCPDSCTTADDCASCGDNGHEAHACHNHKCAQCDTDADCGAGNTCSDAGVCIPICGIPGQVAGTCDTDTDCAGCEGDNHTCNAPINGGHGVCGPSANGCSDLGNGVVVLPAPFDQVTNACSNDSDCSGVGVQYNVGKLLRDITGLSSIDDANIEYPMARCADVTVGTGDNSISCGICVPCKTDDDCMDINVDDVAGDAFGPLGAIATALLLDQLFGANDHLIHMFCQPVAAGYGVCAPCPTLINDCVGGGGGGSGNCDHDVCTTGDALDPMCGSCAAAVCDLDDFCCSTTWDDICVGHVDTECAAGCDGSGGGCHDQCTAGDALNASCNSCVSQICSSDPYCCQTSWDDVCVGEVQTVCSGQCAGTGCAHSECEQGGPLDSGCSDCAMTVCGSDDFCCTTDWDAVCVSSAQSDCSGTCTGGGCAHDECQQGGPLDMSCSSCAGSVCASDSFCCDTNWDSTCVMEAGADSNCSC